MKLLSRKEACAPIGRWTAYRKRELLLAVEKGNVRAEEVMQAHGIAAEEWETWKLALLRSGVKALKAKALRRMA